MSSAAHDEVVVFIHSTGTGPFLWASVPPAAVGGRRTIFPANVGYPPGELVARGRRLTSVDDAALVAESIPDDAARVHVVAHSYGALVALQTMLGLGERVASVFFYEPVLYAALRNAAALEPEAYAEAQTFIEHPWFLRDDDRGGGAEWQEMFIDYWNRPGSWSKMPNHLREMSLALGWKMFQEVRAVFFDEEPAGGWLLSAPTTIAVGERTTATSRGMSKMLAHARANVTVVEMAGLTHMAPLTNAGRVHEELGRHFARIDQVAR